MRKRDLEMEQQQREIELEKEQQQRETELEMEQQQREIELEMEQQKREMQLEKEKQQREMELEKDKQQQEIELKKEKQKRAMKMDTEFVQLMRALWELALNEVKEVREREMEIRQFSTRMEIAQLEKQIRHALKFLEGRSCQGKSSSEYDAVQKRMRMESMAIFRTHTAF